MNNICDCKDQYSIEKHGDGWALYLGRCPHRHGYNLAYMTDLDVDKLNHMLDLLNSIDKDKEMT